MRRSLGDSVRAIDSGNQHPKAPKSRHRRGTRLKVGRVACRQSWIGGLESIQHQERSMTSPTCQFRARWYAKADVTVIGNQSGIKPSRCGGFFYGRIYSELPCPDNCQNG
jgi:hypothetical protein